MLNGLIYLFEPVIFRIVHTKYLPSLILHGGTVAQWLALSPHSKKVLGSNPN